MTSNTVNPFEVNPFEVNPFDIDRNDMMDNINDNHDSKQIRQLLELNTYHVRKPIGDKESKDKDGNINNVYNYLNINAGHVYVNNIKNNNNKFFKKVITNKLCEMNEGNTNH